MVVAIPSRAPPKNKGRAISVLSIKLPIRCGREDREIKLSDLGSWRILLNSSLLIVGVLLAGGRFT